MDAPNALAKALANANLAAVLSIAILYGTHLIVYPICIYVLLGKRSRGQPIHWVLLTCVTSQFIVLTIEVAVQLLMTFQSFVDLADKPNALIQIGIYWNTVGSLNHKLAQVCSLINVGIGDAIIVWRVWILCHHHTFLVCLPPIMTHLGGVSCAIVMLHSAWKGTTIEFIRHVGTATWSLTMCTQVYSTLIISWKIWHLGVANAKAGGSRTVASYYRAIIVMMIESGAVLTAFVLALIVTIATGSNAYLTLAAAMDPLAALIPASIIIRVGMKRNHQFRMTVLSQITPQVSGEKQIEARPGVGITFAKSQNSVGEDSV